MVLRVELLAVGFVCPFAEYAGGEVLDVLDVGSEGEGAVEEAHVRIVVGLADMG